MNAKLLFSYASAILLAACVSTPQSGDWPEAQKVEDFTADGRLSVKVEGKGSYANFDWAYQNQVQTISVNTPLGSTVGQLCQDAQGVLAVDNKGKVYRAQTAEELSRQLLGYELPVQYLHIWANGRRVAGTPYKMTSDGRLQQFGWTVSRTLNGEGRPRILLLEGNKLNIRLVFDEMNNRPKPSSQTRCAARG
ncbi:lipoprotein insertase outer membrane protein LolB [Neisseria chenwenguii]|uniref:Outer-membrane lipoprotein LolB n=1 Tax=Neisseria chenwenguii TaxID=1853278 RepID=A0A220S477_9NEIS|nr:lipoprotein insertase outer membrane protein LolB [Neisseria chenwenguii]ASK28143.1 outer membrane lipoprotein LolB [Neisseria chenwenguii]ROV57295.1 outer membrane lipoprotein LolB [Neisseria chenwenguii]